MSLVQEKSLLIVIAIQAMLIIFLIGLLMISLEKHRMLKRQFCRKCYVIEIHLVSRFLSRVSENMEIGSHVHKLLALTIAKVERCHLATLECMNPNHK